MLGENGLDDGGLGDGFAGLGGRFSLFLLRLVVVDVELEDVFVFDGVSDGVLVQLLLEDVFCFQVAGFLAVDFTVSGVCFEDGSAGEAEEL